MATQFSDIYQFVRTILGDDDEQNLMYQSSTLKMHIELWVAFRSSSGIQIDGSEDQFVQDLTPKQKVLMALEIAIGLISPQADYFSYTNPVLTVSRKAGKNDLIDYLRRMLDDLKGGFLHMQQDTEMWAWYNRWDRFWNEYDEIPVER